MRNVTVILTSLVLVCGCNQWWGIDDGDDNGPSQETGVSTLETFGSADELKAYFSSVASTGYRNAVDAPTGTLDGDMAWEDDLAAPGGDDGAVGDETAAPDAPADGDSSDEASFSGTTTQEEGVQEADVVKNDGSYIYVLTDGRLRIVQTDSDQGLQDLASHALEGWGQDLYKLPDTASEATRIVAITQVDNWYTGYDDGEFVIAQVEPALVSPWFFNPQTAVTVLDVSDHAHPVVESTSTFQGSLTSSRMVDDVLYMVLVNYPDYYGGLEDTDFEEVDINDLLPDYSVVTSNGVVASGNTVEWDDFYRPTDPDGFGMTTIVTWDVNNPADLHSVAVVAQPGNLYASTQAIYLTDTDYDFYTGDYRETTDIYKFAYAERGVELIATGSVPGRVLNQYSMSEYEGHLRIATTTGAVWFADQEAIPSLNNLYVLGEGDGQLTVVGRIENLAPGEEIKSARFIGPWGYLVTFEQIDPLFTFDLSNPANPVKVGELKVPGFSSFITPMGSEYLLTVGQDINLDAGWPRAAGVQLSIFKIADLANPELVYKEVIGAEGTYSEALHNPKAFTYFAARDLLALPIEDYGWGWIEDDWIVGDEVVDEPTSSTPQTSVIRAAAEVEPGFNGVYVYRVTAQSGFEYLGKMTTRLETDDDYWWYYSAFSRGLFIGDNVYAVNERGVVGAPITDVDSAPWRVEFPIEESPYPDGEPVEPEEDVAPPPDPDELGGDAGDVEDA
ncbi:MAG: beta-propeller domain-containing protein [Phycisphaerales bacterium]|nr:MAG: beta-propeller domain-containing protein [Phycisphaerales bacterium]